MNLVKRIGVLLCSMILVSFTLTGFVFTTTSFLSHNGEDENGQIVYRSVDNGKKKLPSTDATKDESEILLKNIQMGKLKMTRNGVLFVMWILISFLYIWRFSPLWSYVRLFRHRAFHMARFRSELINQKEKDGKKRVTGMI